jgi:hypothetical protein
MLQMLPQHVIHGGEPCIRAHRRLRYLVTMYFVAISNFLPLLFAAVTAQPVLAQTGPLRGSAPAGLGALHNVLTNPMPGLPPGAHPGAAVAAQAPEGGSAMALGQTVLPPIKVTPANDLRSALQLQKARLQESAQAERLLTTRERTELRQLLRQQREGNPTTSASN